ncbi:MAG: hypothetical protein JXQ80_02765 [Bacteroidales bacterium]|nr:hypothetical protein [Bacteroidales bacterium]
MQVLSLVISACAFVFSVVAFVFVRRQQTATLDLQRDLSFEGKLADWPDAFIIHGINIEAAKAEGITAKQIAYLILSINALAVYCRANSIGIYEQIIVSDYRQRMFAQPHTQLVWRYARFCIPMDIAKSIDRYLYVKYGLQY